MTNSRLTDPEVLESRFPVVLEDFHIRRGSGGRGALERGRRHAAPHPLPRADGSWRSSAAGGGWRVSASRAARRANSGATACAAPTGSWETLGGCDQTALAAGEAVEIVTPTGGGWGKRD